MTDPREIKCIVCEEFLVAMKLPSDTGAVHRHMNCPKDEGHPVYCKNEKRWIEF